MKLLVAQIVFENEVLTGVYTSKQSLEEAALRVLRAEAERWQQEGARIGRYGNEALEHLDAKELYKALSVMTEYVGECLTVWELSADETFSGSYNEMELPLKG